MSKPRNMGNLVKSRRSFWDQILDGHLAGGIDGRRRKPVTLSDRITRGMMSGWGHWRRHCHVRLLVRYGAPRSMKMGTTPFAIAL